MRAIDTNAVVRFLTNDDKRQAKAARAAIEAGDIYIALTVLLGGRMGVARRLWLRACPDRRELS